MVRILLRVAVVAMLGLGLAGAARADDFADYAQALTRLKVLAAGAADAKAMPRMSDVEGGKLLATLSDTRRFLDSKSYAMTDLEPVSTLCVGATEALGLYMMHGMGKPIINKDGDVQDLSMSETLTAGLNLLKFQDEFSVLIVFINKCSAKQIPLLEDVLVALGPEQLTAEIRSDLQEVKQGISNGYLGFFGGLNAPGFKSANRRLILGTMADVAPVYSDLLSLEARKQVADAARSTMKVAGPEVSAELNKIVEAMGNTRCIKLCAL
jgi:hypothetical protein